MYDTLLVPTDGTDGATAAAGHALVLARAFDAEVHVLSVVDDRAFAAGSAGTEAVNPEVWDVFEEQAADAVAAIEPTVTEAGVECHTAVEHGVPHRAILSYAEENGVDAIAMGTHGRTGLDRLLMGSVTERVVRKSEVPVLTTRLEAEAPNEYERVLIPTDGSDIAGAALEHGVAIADAMDATVHALSIVDVGSLGAAYDSGAGIETLIQGLREDATRAVTEVESECEARGVDVRKTVTQGSVHAAIEDYVEEESIDLVTMGTHGRTGVGRLLLGSVTERVLRASEAPVLTVR